MAARGKNEKLSGRLDILRAKGLWDKVADFVKSLQPKQNVLDLDSKLTSLAIAESQLELYLQQFPPLEVNVEHARRELVGVRSKLEDLTATEHPWQKEALLLLVKTLYVMGLDPCDALNRCSLVQLEPISYESRFCKVIAEGWAIRGFCYEHEEGEDGERLTLGDPQCSSFCYDKAANLYIRHLQEVEQLTLPLDLSDPGTSSVSSASVAVSLPTASIASDNADPSSPNTTAQRHIYVARWLSHADDVANSTFSLSSTDSVDGALSNLDVDEARQKYRKQLSNDLVRQKNRMGPILEVVIQKSCLSYLKKGMVNECIERFRQILMFSEAQGLASVRQILSCQLAELLLRGVSKSNYFSPKIMNINDVEKDASAINGVSSCLPTYSSLSNAYIPSNLNDEILLLLLFSEQGTAADVILTRMPDHYVERVQSFRNVVTVYDLLTITLLRYRDFPRLSNCFEKALRFSFEESYIWQQFGLSLLSCGKHARALSVLKECTRLSPTDVQNLLQLSKICYTLEKLDEGVDFALKAVEHSKGSFVEARAKVFLGIGYSLKAEELRIPEEKDKMREKAEAVYREALHLDPFDYNSLFFLALELACQRKIEAGRRFCLQASKLCPSHVPSLQLLALLLTAQKQFGKALDVLTSASECNPNSLGLLFIKSLVEQHLSKFDVCLNTCKQMLSVWKDSYSSLVSKDVCNGGVSTLPTPEITTLRRSQVDSHSVSQYAESLNGSVLTEADTHFNTDRLCSTSILHVLNPETLLVGCVNGSKSVSEKFGPLYLQQAIWVHLSEIYLSIDADQIEEARSCLLEATLLGLPVSSQMHYMNGRVHQQLGEMSEARKCFETAIALNPLHHKSLQALASILHDDGLSRAAAKYLRDALVVQPLNHDTWSTLGQILSAEGDIDGSNECLIRSLQLESTAPVVSFSLLPRMF